MLIRSRFLVACSALSFSISAYSQTMTPSEMKWVKVPILPGVEESVLDGDPSKPGPFIIRVKFPDGAKVAPHTHPVAEHVTIIQGTFLIAEGEKWDDSKLKPVPTGGVFKQDTGPHYAQAKGETIIQIQAQGPWGLTFIDPSDDPTRKQKSQ